MRIFNKRSSNGGFFTTCSSMCPITQEKLSQVARLLKSLGLFVELRQRHQSALMIGNAASGWVRVSSWTPSEKLAKLAESMSSAKRVANASIHRQ